MDVSTDFSDGSASTDPVIGRPVGATENLWRAGRRVHIAHFAFARAVINGLPVAASYNRYLANEGDGERSGATTIRWLRSEFVAAARKQHRPGTARLLEIDVSKIPAPKKALPNIDDWARETGWEGFSESEILQAYQEAHADDAGDDLAKRTRLVEKQLDALHWLEDLIAAKPAPGDSCGAWFTESLQHQLGDAGVYTLAQLIERINGMGRNWYRAVARVGPAKAKRIEAWLREHADEIGMTLGQHVTVPISKLYPEELDKLMVAATAIQPLDKLVIPAELDGRAGKYRQPQAQCLLAASNDYEAILAWIRSKRALSVEAQAELRRRRRGAMNRHPSDPLAWLDVLSDTQRAARKEAERFLLWAVLERQKPMSSMTVEDCTAYREFIANPPLDWCAPAGRHRWSPLWRPFVGPLSASAQQFAVVMLKNLFSFLVSQNYLMGNPWVAVAPANGEHGKTSVTSRSFTKAQWTFIGNRLKVQLEDSDEHEKGLRLLFAMTFLYSTGLRRSEAVKARIKDLEYMEYPWEGGDAEPTTGWELTVVGKRGKVREVPVSPRLIELLRLYLKSRGLSKSLGHAAMADEFLLAPLIDRGSVASSLESSIVPIDDEKQHGLAADTLYRLLKVFFVECAQELAIQGKSGARKFVNASTHWLRHTHASHHVADGIPLEIVQDLLGHASLNTTKLYVTTEKARRMRAVQATW